MDRCLSGRSSDIDIFIAGWAVDVWPYVCAALDMERSENKTSTGSLAAVYILGVGYEALQSIGITPGTYDKIDLAFMIIGGQLPVIVDYIIQTKTK